MSRALIFGAVIVGLALLIGGCGLNGYNQAITLDTEVKAAWAQVDNQLQRRFELIPNLVETVKGITGQEQKVFLGIAEARTKYFSATSTADKVDAANQTQSAIARLLLLQEQYPQLKSNESFLKLQDTLEGTENRVAVERGRYNDKVKELDRFMRQFPSSIWAGLARIETPQYFKSDEGAKTAPKVDFSK